MALAFALTSTMLSLPYRSPKTWDLLQFVSIASRMSMQEKALHASSPQAPYMCPLLVEYTANQALNTLCHFVHVFLILQLFPASETILGLSGEVIVMSKAAVSLTPQRDTRILAGLVLNSSLPKPHPASRRAGNEAR